jgi:peptide/nickel transport system substrate-binding protein
VGRCSRTAGHRTRAALAAGVCLLVAACDGPQPSDTRLRAVLARALDTRAPYGRMEGGAGGNSATLSLNVYEGLVRFGSDRRPVPALASSWRNPDEFTWVFDLRAGVRFHDGSVLGADDVVAVVEGARGRRLTLGAHFADIEEVAASDARTVRIRTRQRNPLLLGQLSTLPIATARDLLSGSPAPNGTGPYRLAAAEAEGRYRLEAFAQYWGERPPWTEVDVAVVADPVARAGALLRGEADFAERLGPAQVAEVERRAGFQVLKGAARDTTVLGLTLAAGGALADPRVREAIDLALDREALAASGLAGSAQPARQLVPFGVFGSAGLPATRRDLARARSLLATTGRALPLVVPLACTEEQAPLAGRLRADLAEAGIAVQVQALPATRLRELLDQRGAAAFLARVRALSADGIDVLINHFHTPDPANQRGMMNWTGHADRQLDGLLDRARGELDWGLRSELLGQAMTAAVRSRALLPLLTRHESHGARTGLAFRGEPRGFLRFADLRPAADGAAAR